MESGSVIILKNPRPTLSEDDTKTLEASFKQLASKSTHLLNVNELKEIMESLGEDKGNPIFYHFITNLVTKQEGKGISFDDFIAELNKPMIDNVSMMESDKLFDLFVENEGDKIESKHIEKAFKQLDEEVDSEEIKKILVHTAFNGTEITKDDLYTILSKK